MLSDNASKAFHKSITNRFKFWLFSATKFPSLNYWGIRLNHLDEHECDVTIKYNRKNTNPFGSIYFAALNGAAELPTGILLQYHLQSKGKYSMLVGSAQSNYMKKATGLIKFTCKEGEKVAVALGQLTQPGDNCKLELTASGINEDGAEVMNQTVLWYVKLK